MSGLKHLVIGMNGTIGSALFARLRESGAAVWGTTQRQQMVADSSTLYLNLRDPSSWSFAQKFDVVYFCAGICRMNLCEDDPLDTYHVNVDATLALAQRLSDQGAHFIFLSTNQVFSGDVPFVAADARYQPLNEYGRQKATIEELLRVNIPCLAIVRLTKVVEPRMQLIENWIQNLRQGQAVQAFTDMMLAPVTLRQVIDVLVKIGEKRQNGIFQVSGSEDISYYDLANYLANHLGCSASLVQAVKAEEKGMRKSFLPKFTTLDCSSIIAAVSENPPHYAEVLQECFECV
jgi:dTDP-4-dehydrorhamnose reductase